MTTEDTQTGLGTPLDAALPLTVDDRPSDRLARPLRNLRISVIDRCNLRCSYCMPEKEYLWLPRDDILAVDEIERAVRVFADVGVERIRLTGGEPLLRKDFEDVVRAVASDERVRDVSMTTNAVLLAPHASALHEAGLDRVTISLDTLRPQRFAELTLRREFERVIEGVHAASEAGLSPLKINTVVMRGYNDDELIDLIEFGKEHDAEVRFIEYMDVGGATRWSIELVVSRAEMLSRIARHYGAVEELTEDAWAPADRFRLPDGTSFGIIASTTEPFCRTCDRSRLTADGIWFLCLYAATGVDLRAPLRSGASEAELRDLIAGRWSDRADRGAEQRKALGERGPLYRIEDLRRDPHMEMHTRGG